MEPIEVRIQNFQSIQDVEFKIHGMTCIVGKTNIGKSATLRSIASAILNQPVTNMIRHGERYCTVDLHSKDWGFRWEKGSGINRYTLDGKEEVLDSVGRGQIDEIRDYGFGTIKIGENKYLSPWYANQYESVFLLDQSGPAITDFISEVSRLDVLQKAIVFLNREKKRFKDKIKLIESDIQSIEQKQQKLSRLSELKQVQKELHLQRDSINEYAKRIQIAEGFQARMKRLSTEIEILEHIQTIKVPRPIDSQMLTSLQNLQRLQMRLERGARSIRNIRNIETVKVPDVESLPDVRKLAQAQKLLKRKERLERLIRFMESDIKIPEPPVQAISTKLQDGLKLLRRMSRLQAEISEQETKLQRLETKLEDVKVRISAIPKCPTCDRPWTNGAVHHHSVSLTS